MADPLTDRLCSGSESVGDALAELAEKNRVLAEERLSKIDTETQLTEEIAKREESAGFWQTFVEEPLEEAGREFVETFGGDATSVAEAKANLESLVHSFFDPDAFLANLSAGILPSDVVSLDRFFGDAAFPSSIIERVPNLGGVKDGQASKPCQSQLIAATIATAGKVVAGATSNAARAMKTVSTTLGLMKEKFDELGPALMQMPVQNLLALIGSQDAVIGQIISVTKEIIDTVDGMQAEDYPADHIALIRREQSRLQGAETKLGANEARILAGATFSQPLWDAARDDVALAAKNLCTLDIDVLVGGLTAKPFKLIGLVTYLEQLCAILQRTQTQREAIEGLISTFEKTYLEEARFDNLFAPIIDQIRCRIRKVVEDMDATIEKNQYIRYLIKEKQWCLELMAIKAAMDFSNKLDLPDAVNEFTGTKAIRDAADDVYNEIGNLRRDLLQVDVRQLLFICNSFTKNVRIKATRNVPYEAIVAEGEYLIQQAELCRRNGSVFGGLLNTLDGSIGKAAGLAITAVQVLLEFAKDRSLTSFVEALKIGDISEALGVDALTTTLEGQLITLVACIVKTARENGGNPVAEAELLLAKEMFEDDARSLALLDELMNDYADAHIEEQIEVEAAKIKENEARIKRAAEALGESTSTAESRFIPPKQAKEAKLRAATQN